VSGQGGSEKRKDPRVKAGFIVTCQLDKPSHVQMWSGAGTGTDALMGDLSEKGMAVVAKYDVPVGTMVSVGFTLIDFHARDDDRMRTMEITGVVRHRAVTDKKEYRLGIVFTGISSADKAALSDFIAMEK